MPKMKGIGSFLLPLMLALPLAAAAMPSGTAQDPPAASVSAGVSSEKIGLDDTLIYTLTFVDIEDAVQPDLSHLDDFRTLQTSRSSEFQFRDGASTSSTRFTYYLMPTRTGRLSLPPVPYRHQGREYRTQGFTVEVVKGSLVPGGAPRPGPASVFGDDFPDSPFQDRPLRQPDSYLRAVLSKAACLKGEQLLFRVLLYTRDRIAAVNMTSSPSFAGFWQEWFPAPQSISAGSENVDGVIYQVYEIRKAALFASESGTLTIPALQFELELADPRSVLIGAQALRRSTQEIKVRVAEPPAAAAGLPVGRFSFTLRSPQKKADINEIVTLLMEIRGSGNCKAIMPPAVPASEQALVYPAKITQETAYSPGALAGTLRAEIPVSFKRAGTVTFPALEFRYFDPARGIVSLASTPLTIQVSGEKLPADLARTLPSSAIVQKGSDIEFIKQGPLRDRGRRIHRQKWFAALIFAMFAANLLVLLKKTVWDRRIAVSPLLLNRRILARALHRLQEARQAGDIAPAMESYICEKSGLGPAEVNDRKIAEILGRHRVPQECIDQFLFIKGQSDLAKYSQGKKSALELKKDLQTLRRLLKVIDGKMK